MGLQRIVCHHCKHTWTVETALGRRDECPKCHHDAKVCLNCRHFDRGAHHECREEQAEWVKEKDRGNFCSYFEPRTGGDDLDSAAAKARDRLEGLFGGAKSESVAKPGANFQEELQRFLDAKKR